jgi:hypothetical protein
LADVTPQVLEALADAQRFPNLAALSYTTFGTHASPPHCWVITPLSCAITRALTGGGWPDAYADEDNDDEDEANKPSDLEVQCLDAFLRRRPYVRYPPATIF